MLKLDYKKKLSYLYAPGAKDIQSLEVPEMRFVMIDGTGSPDDIQYIEAVEALYSISYTLKFMIKKAEEIDFGVMPLEGLWWADDMTDFLENRKANWKWTALIMQPEYVTEGLFNSTISKLKTSKNLNSLAKARLEKFREGLCAQIMYFGPYSQEGPTIRKIHEFIEKDGFSLYGKHHEIYLNDPRRSRPDKLKTIIRQPMVKKL